VARLSREDRTLGAMLGLAVGDALGLSLTACEPPE
jgi:ADP-ribosylglycohydrolase